MKKRTKALLAGVAALGMIGGGLAGGVGAPEAEAAGGKFYSSKNYCLIVAADAQMSGAKIVTRCAYVPGLGYLLVWK